eukprot:552484_1
MLYLLAVLTTAIAISDNKDDNTNTQDLTNALPRRLLQFAEQGKPADHGPGLMGNRPPMADHGPMGRPGPPHDVVPESKPVEQIIAHDEEQQASMIWDKGSDITGRGAQGLAAERGGGSGGSHGGSGGGSGGGSHGGGSGGSGGGGSHGGSGGGSSGGHGGSSGGGGGSGGSHGGGSGGDSYDRGYSGGNSHGGSGGSGGSNGSGDDEGVENLKQFCITTLG